MSNEVSKLISELADSPYDSAKYDSVLRNLRTREYDDSDQYTIIEEIRLAKLKHFRITDTEMADWIRDIQKITNIGEQKWHLLKYYSYIIADHPIVQYWEPCLQLAISIYLSTDQPTDLTITLEQLKSLFDQAIQETLYDYQSGFRIWNIVLRFYEDNQNNIFPNGEKPFEILLGLHKKRLAVPHSTLDESFQEFSSFISRNDNANYSKHMQSINKIYNASKKRQRYYDIHELSIAKDSKNLKLWLNYLQEVCKYANGDTHLMNNLFERAIHETDNCIEVWLSYVYVIYDKNNKFSDSQIESFLNAFVRTFPSSPLSYAEYVRNCTQFKQNGFQKFLEARERISANKDQIMESNRYDEWKILALSLLTFEISIARSGENLEVVDLLYKDAAEFVDFAISKNNDAFHTVEKTAIMIFEELEDSENAKAIVKGLLAKFNDQVDIWLFACDYERRNGEDIDVISKLLEAAVENAINLDWPEKVIQEWLTMKQLNFDVSEYKRSLLKANKAYTLVNIERIKRQEALESEIQASPINGKRTRTDEPDLSTQADIPTSKRVKSDDQRKRESFTVKVTNLPQDTTEAKLNEFFKDCGEIREVKIFNGIEEANTLQATVEFHSDREILAALTKNFKKIDDQQVFVTKAATSTVFVSNFPPSIDHKNLEEFFSTIGSIVSARFPSLKYNKSRRFCYIEYASPELADLAVSKFDKAELIDELDGKKYNLVVKISQPEKKQSRGVKEDNENEIAAAEQREIFVQNLNFAKVSKEVLEQEFAQYGKIEKVTLPLKPDNNNEKKLNNGFGFITYVSATSAKDSLAKNGGLLLGRKISVSIAQPKKEQAKSLTGSKSKYFFDAARTISLLNVDDTVSEDLIRSFASTVGSISHVELVPEDGGAYVEFNNISDSGKASMELSGRELGSNVIHVGSFFDLKSKNKEGNEKKPSLMIPTSVAKRKKRKL